MKHLLIATIAAVVLVGCGPSETEKAMINAAYRGSISEVKLHLEAGVNVNAQNEGGDSALHGAARRGHNELALFLIQKGADLYATDQFGIPPFHPLVRKCSKEVLELCISKGVNVNYRESNYSSATALCYAVQNMTDDAKEIVELLISKGADVNAKHNGGNDTPLDNANPEVADLLRKHGGKTAEELKAEGK